MMLKNARAGFVSVVAGIVMAASWLAIGCGDDDVAQATGGGDASADGAYVFESSPTPIADGGVKVVDPAAQVARGTYLVKSVLQCSSCHTPMVAGVPDMTKFLSGVECYVDGNGPQPGGCLNTRNLTNDDTGLKQYSDHEIKWMFTEGKAPGRNLFPICPYWAYKNLTEDDADAIVAYLRTVPPVVHHVPPSDPPFTPPGGAATPIIPNTIPPATGSATENGRYLAAVACINCHTPPLPPGPPRPIDMSKPFAGSNPFRIGLPSPPYPMIIYSTNLTPHASGIAGWTVADIVRVLTENKDKNGNGVCPPMGGGPMSRYATMTDQDKQDIANYLLALPPIDLTPPNACQTP